MYSTLILYKKLLCLILGLGPIYQNNDERPSLNFPNVWNDDDVDNDVHQPF